METVNDWPNDEQPTAHTAEQSTHYIAEQSTHYIAQQKIEHQAEQTFEHPAEKQAEFPAEQPNERPVSKLPAEQQYASEQPAEHQAEQPTGHPSEKPTYHAADQQNDHPVDNPAEKSNEHPADQPTHNPAEQPNEPQTEQPVVQLNERKRKCGRRAKRGLTQYIKYSKVERRKLYNRELAAKKKRLQAEAALVELSVRSETSSQTCTSLTESKEYHGMPVCTDYDFVINIIPQQDGEEDIDVKKIKQEPVLNSDHEEPRTVELPDVQMKFENMFQSQAVCEENHGNHKQCSICGKIFRQESFLELHMKKIHGKNLNAIIAGSVGHATSHAPVWEIASDEKVEGKPKRCYICGKLFSLEEYLEIHMKRSHGVDRDVASAESVFSKASQEDLVPGKAQPIRRKRSNCRKGKGYHKRCPICSKLISTQYGNFARHVTRYHGCTCTICKRVFSDKAYLKKHLKSHMGQKPCACGKCGKCNLRFMRKDGLSIHTHFQNNTEKSQRKKPYGVRNVLSTADEIFKCIICNESFVSENLLKVHMKATHYDKAPYKCPLCEKSYTSMDNLLNHTRLHSGEKPYECPECGKRFKSRSYTLKHMIIHREEKPYKCSLCSNSFSFKVNLSSHLRTHGGEKLCVEKLHGCTICDEKFNHKGALSRHLKKHSGNEPYVCDVCGLKFVTKSQFDDHLITHSGERPFGCSICANTFKRKYDCTRHQLKIHGLKQSDCIIDEAALQRKSCERLMRPAGKKYQCSICREKFGEKRRFARHLRSHSEEDYTCSICDYTFTSKWHYAKHMRSHSDKKPTKNERRYGCSNCGKQFLTKGHLAIHVVRHTDATPWACSVCEKQFKSKYARNAHEKAHGREKSHGCNLCGKMFRQKSDCTKHLYYVHGMKQ